jgi:hypothetical protein
MHARRLEIDRVAGHIAPDDRATVVRALDTFVRAAGDRRPGAGSQQLATHGSPIASNTHPEDL